MYSTAQMNLATVLEDITRMMIELYMYIYSERERERDESFRKYSCDAVNINKAGS